MTRRVGRHVRELARALNLTRTATRILDVLTRSQKHLSVQDIVRRLRLSERSVRGNLSLLVRRGLLERKVVVTAHKRLAYLYRLKPPHEMMEALRAEFATNLRHIQRILAKVSPRSASSSRN